MTYTNSDLVTYTKISPNKTSPRNHVIDCITIHCVVGQWSAKTIGDFFAKSSVEASCNYGVGYDGSIALCVEEKDRSWCSSNRDNDNRAITIEVASDTTHPYAVTDKALSALIELVADICKRNNIKELKWKGDKSLIGQVDKQNMTVHRWFDNKSCPGDYLYNKHSYIAEQVNKKIGSVNTGDTTKPSTPTSNTSNIKYPNTPFTVKVIIDNLNYRATPSLSGAVKGQTGKGVFTITEVKDGWGRLKSNVGWIYLENENYCTIGSTTKTPTSTFKPYTVKVTADVLNIRAGAGTNYNVVTQIKNHGVYTIVDEATGNGATKWGLLKSYEKNRNGWISLDYAKRV